MKTMISVVALAATLALCGAAQAQVPTGGADAKGNAPLKPPHTVNDGGARRGATSFTEREARRHIEHSGYSSISPLTKGGDGVWRGTATKNGVALKIGLDFKGNVVEAGPAVAGQATGVTHGAMPVAAAASANRSAMSTTSSNTSSASTAAPHTTAGSSGHAHHRMRHHRRWRHRHGHHAMRAACVNPGPNGVACSGVDRNHNGISDKEDRAIKAGAKP